MIIISGPIITPVLEKKQHLVAKMQELSEQLLGVVIPLDKLIGEENGMRVCKYDKVLKEMVAQKIAYHDVTVFNDFAEDSTRLMTMLDLAFSEKA